MKSKKDSAVPKTTVEYLDAVKAKYELESDYALAKKLQIPQQMVSSYRNGKMLLKDEDCIWVAKLLEMDAVYVMSCIHAEKAARADRTEVKEAWEDFLKKLVPCIAAPVLAFSPIGDYGTAHAANLTPCKLSEPKKRRRKNAVS